MDFDKGLHSKRVVTPSGIKDATILIKNGKITEVIEGKPPGIEGIEELGNAAVMPGIIDAHVHINEPGRTDWEGFDTATRAAAAGGVTTLIEMPLNASPVTTTAAAFEQKLAATEGKLHVNCGFYGGLVPGNLHNLPELMRAGVFGIKCFLTHSGIDDFPNVTESDLQKAMPLIEKTGLPLLVHAELDSPHPKIKYHHNYPTSYHAFLESRPKTWENRAIELMIRLCETTHCRTHIVHLSTVDMMNALEAAKERLPITVETVAHYLYFAADTIPDGQTIYKCAPPIRDDRNNFQLWLGLERKVIDFIASDHSPAPPALKALDTGDLVKAWGGIAGLQFTLPAVWTKGAEFQVDLADMALWLCSHPAEFLGLTHKGRIEPGMDADLVVWDPEDSFVVEEKDIHFRHKITPYLGEELYGKVMQTYVAGEKVFDRGVFVILNRGQVLLK